MSDYSYKLATLTAKKEKLLATEIKLINKRKMEMANLIERCELLTFSDELFAGIFLELKKWIMEKNDRIKEWEIAGGRFLKSTKIKQTNSEAAQTVADTESSTY